MQKSLKLPTFQDGTVKFYKFTTCVVAHTISEGIHVQGTHGLLDRAILMWRCEEHYKQKFRGEPERDLGKYYIISWQAYGPGYNKCQQVGEALDYHEKKGWSLMHSEGPNHSAKMIPDYYFDPAKMDYESRPLFVGDRMKKLPKNWAEVNSAVIAEMDKKPSDKQLELLNTLSRQNLFDVVKALKEGKI